MCIWWHSAVSCTSISVVKDLYFFQNFGKTKGFLNVSYFHEAIHFILYQTLLPKRRCFQPHIATCQAPFQFMFLKKKEIQTGVLTLKRAKTCAVIILSDGPETVILYLSIWLQHLNEHDRVATFHILGSWYAQKKCALVLYVSAWTIMTPLWIGETAQTRSPSCKPKKSMSNIFTSSPSHVYTKSAGSQGFGM